MRLVEELEGTIAPDERAELIVGLLEMIDRWNAVLDKHHADPDPDRVAIREITDRRNSYVEQLALLLHQYRVEVQLPKRGMSEQQQANWAMQIEDILEEMPQTPQERAELIEYLLEMIEHWNAGIKRHESYPERDTFTIEQFTERRDKYIGQLALVLKH